MGVQTKQTRSWASARRLLLLVAVFAASRAALLISRPSSSNVDSYTRYAHEQLVAAHEGVSFYQVHAREVQREADWARATGTLVGSIDERKDAEYPPLALAALRLPTIWMRAQPLSDSLTPEFVQDYRAAFRLGMAAVDVLLFILVTALVRRLFRSAGSEAQDRRIMAYLATTAVLCPLLYERLDLILALLVTFALFLLVSRCHYAWSFAVLALAINFKLVPLVLAPLWVVGSMSGEHGLHLLRPRALAALGLRVGLLTVMVVAFFLPFFFRDGNASLGFFAYHRTRGLEIEATYGLLPLALHLLGYPLHVRYAHLSFNLQSSLSSALAALAAWLSAGALLAASSLFLVDVRWSAASGDACPARATRAQLAPDRYTRYTLLFLMLFIATNKVFSPQYLFWVAPLVCLVPLGHHRSRRFFWTFILSCAAAIAVHPFLLVADLVSPAGAKMVPAVANDPTARLAVLLIVKNLLFLAATGLLLADVLAAFSARLRGVAGRPDEPVHLVR